MPKLTVWIATQEDDSSVYNIVTKTKAEALIEIGKRPSTRFEAPKKVVIEYRDAFELFELATSEAGGRHAYY